MALKISVKKSARNDGFGGPTLGGLPHLVAQDEGLFAAEGLEVVYALQDVSWAKHPTGEKNIEEVSSYNRHQLFEDGGSEVFGACEWGQVRRAADSKRGGKIVGRNDGAQWHAIVAAPNSPFKHPRALYNQPVAVRFHAGSHYATLELLEGFIERDEIKLVNLTHLEGFEAVTRGEIAAVTLPEPWITFAQKRGYRVLAETREFSAEIGAPELNPQAYAAYNRARRRGAEILNADKAKYVRKYFGAITGSLPEEFKKEVAPEDFNLNRLEWFGPQPYTPEDFRRTYNWMVARNLVKGGADYDGIVARNFLEVA